MYYFLAKLEIKDMILYSIISTVNTIPIFEVWYNLSFFLVFGQTPPPDYAFINKVYTYRI